MKAPLRIALLSTLLVAAVPSSTASAGGTTCAGASAAPTARTVAKARAATMCLINRERRKHGLAALRTNRTLQASSTLYAHEMVKQGFFAHVSPAGETLTERIKEDTRYLARARGWEIGENLAWGTGTKATPAQIVAGWMNSPDHRANILHASYREMGLGIAIGTPVPAASAAAGGATYTNQFGRRG